ncbi:type II toxin-antitoxin system RelE family toxin [Xylocopilactobacillus apis]|uniref:Type II toxin-antitoxin system RelE/ParE family toxin n=1 Tax=Xylocopilactobacillus apis TaxID=2932183 RepID=A0AAU9DLL0_9LACO|nr:type II toxin-antitoxin system RelE/ParE family toxin [Xylocopilactobacillus apis]BDR55703.1 hypothetical protein KIMC2_02650 [Xylocopilactobacillus apis]
MSKYSVRTTAYFRKSLKKLSPDVQKTIAKFIKKHLIDVDFPDTPGKKLVGNLSGYVRFRIGSYRLITVINDDQLIITTVYVGKRSDVYNVNMKKIR